MDNKTKSMLYRFYSFEGFAAAYFYLPILVIYLTGILDPIQVSILVALKGISTFVFEIPTGIFADSVSRKKSFQISLILIVICMSIFLLTKKFIWLALAQVLFGIADTFQSGADVSWLYDNLSFLGKLSLYEKANQRIFQAQYAFLIVSYSFGAWLFNKNSNYPFFISAICIIISFILCSTIKEYPYIKDSKNISSQKDCSKQVKLKQQPFSIWILVCIGNIMMGIMCAVYIYLVPLILNQSLPATFIGICYSIAMICTIIITNVSHKVENKYYFLARIIPISFLGLCCFIFAFSGNVFVAIIYLVLARVIWGIFDIVYTVLINTQLTDSSIRATVSSIGNGILNATSAITTIVCGTLVKFCGLSLTVLFVGIAFFVLGIVLLRLIQLVERSIPVNRKKRNLHKKKILPTIVQTGSKP